MRTLKKVPIKIKEVEFIPEKLEFGILYYSEKYETTSHLCLCGCGELCVLPIKHGEWDLLKNGGDLCITPSILQRFECKSHYIITNGIANFI